METAQKEELKNIANQLVATGKGILAADESTGTIKKRLDSIGVESNPENNRRYRQVLFTTPKIEKYISGVILFDETIRQSADDGRPFPKLLLDRGVYPGIKVDKGKIDMPNFPGEKITEGLDGLKERLDEYKKMGARFAKWRGVINIGEGTPTRVCIESNAEGLARYAALCQEQGIVPIVEPEVLMDGNHTLQRCEEATYTTLKSVFAKLMDHKVYLEGMLLKPNMILPGKESNEEVAAEKIAERTVACFRDVIPPQMPGVVFLSGGQTPKEATRNLNAMNKRPNLDWQLSFSFGRALQQPVLKAWEGKDENINSAQKAFIKRAKLNSLAREGKYKEDMENE
jgi:fructose-bisphosphate aldolase class I